MISIGFVAPHVNGGLFMLHDKDDHGIVIAAVVLYIDDLLIIGKECFIVLIKDQMKKMFRMHDLDSVSSYLGMNLERNRKHYTIAIH